MAGSDAAGGAPASLVLVFPLAAKSAHACVPSKTIDSIVKSLPCPNDPLIYAVAHSDSSPQETEHQALTALQHDIEQMGANWGGALLLGGAETFEHLYRLPRPWRLSSPYLTGDRLARMRRASGRTSRKGNALHWA